MTDLEGLGKFEAVHYVTHYPNGRANRFHCLIFLKYLHKELKN